MECLHQMKFRDPDRDPDHFALCKWGISLSRLAGLAKPCSQVS